MWRKRKFKDRAEAGQLLASRLQHYANRENVVVLGLARGGVPVAFEIAMALNLPLDVFVVRKLGVPNHEELAMGAIASGGKVVFNHDVIRHADVSQGMMAHVVAKEHGELNRRERLYREDRPTLQVDGKTVIVVDDGLATGATMRVAVEALREHDPSRLVIAIPTAAIDACDQLRHDVDEIVCVMTPSDFRGVGAWYRDFAQTSDDDVRDLLQEAAERTYLTVNRGW